MFLGIISTTSLDEWQFGDQCHGPILFFSYRTVNTRPASWKTRENSLYFYTPVARPIVLRNSRKAVVKTLSFLRPNSSIGRP